MLVSHVSRKSSVGNLAAWASRLMWHSLEVIYLVAAVSPIAIIALLYALVGRAQELLGHAPLSPADNQALVMGSDGRFTGVIGALDTMFQLAPYGLLAVFFIGFALAYKHVNIWPFVLFGLYVMGWLVLFIAAITTNLFWYINLESLR